MNTPTDSTDRQALTTRIKHHALDCVMCGICVPHCPTFALSHNEADGPRGRISLALGLSEGRLSPDAGVVAHLDGCLTCRACESVCPSLVKYGELIDEVRDALTHNEFTSPTTTQPLAAVKPWSWIRDYILSRRQIFGAAWSALTLLDRLKLIAMVRRFGGRLGQTLPPVLPRRFSPSSMKTPVPASQTMTKAVGLFIGCTGESLNGDAVRASIKVLNELDYAVEIPTKQVCCGAMHRHGGDTSTATGLREENRTAFTGRNLSAIIVIGTACTSELQRDQDDGVPFVEITDFLARIPDVEWPKLQPNAARAAIHLPCSQTQALKHPRSTELLLKRIPELGLVPLTTNDRCCGAAGLHVLMYPDQADALRAPKLDEIEQLNPDYVVSANIGCATHIAVGLGASVLHPVELIAQAISTH